MTLEDEIAEAQSYVSEPPKNESNTCEWIILPILWAIGYARRDIESRMADSTGQFPDYTLLPNHSSATYYLEAKAWSVALEDMHVKQALNYANHNGKRFVVLTNGQSWRLYDNAVQGMLVDKLVKQVALLDTNEIIDFLTTLSKQEVLQGSLSRVTSEESQRRLQEAHDLQEQQKREKEAQKISQRQSEIKCLLDTALPTLLSDAKSDLVVFTARSLNEQENLKDVLPETLAEWFIERFKQPIVEREEGVIKSPGTKTPPPLDARQKGSGTWTLKELQDKPVDGKKSRPITLQAPDGTQVSLSSWVQLAEQVVRWLLRQSLHMPVPFASSHRTRYFLNSIPEHKRQELRKKFKKISEPGKVVYMDADRSGEMFLKDLYALCLSMHISPGDFKITVFL